MQMLQRINTENILFSTPRDLNSNISNSSETSFKIKYKTVRHTVKHTSSPQKELGTSSDKMCFLKNIAEGENPFTVNITFVFAVLQTKTFFPKETPPNTERFCLNKDLRTLVSLQYFTVKTSETLVGFIQLF